MWCGAPAPRSSCASPNRVSASAFGGIPVYESRRVVIANNGVGTHDIRVVENVIEDSAFEGIAVVGSDGNLIARIARPATEAAMPRAGPNPRTASAPPFSIRSQTPRRRRTGGQLGAQPLAPEGVTANFWRLRPF